MTETDPLSISGQLVAEKYRIEQLVGEGGFAVVYLAEHTIWKQPVAIKFFSGLSQAPAEHREELLHQFIQEGALLTELSSQTAGIVQARDVGAYTTTSGQWVPYMVLEWLDGTPLDAILQQDQRLGLPWSEAEVVGFLKRILPILDVLPTVISSRPTSS
jgi:serine/threonine protein kinase